MKILLKTIILRLILIVLIITYTVDHVKIVVIITYFLSRDHKMINLNHIFLNIYQYLQQAQSLPILILKI